MPAFHFRVYIPEENLGLNAYVAIEVVWLERKAVLHVIYTHTCFQKDAFISDNMAKRIWTLFIEILASFCCRFLDVLRVAWLPSFMASSFQDAATKCGVVIQTSRIE